MNGKVLAVVLSLLGPIIMVIGLGIIELGAVHWGIPVTLIGAFIIERWFTDVDKEF